MKTGKSTVWAQPEVAFDPAQYSVEQRFFASKDGTKVPMFVVRRKGSSGPAPTLMWGYGGFNISYTPSFSSSRIAWLEQGGVYVLVNLRGGGEYGKAWHDGGRLANKQNVFDDFIAAGEYLIAQGITTKGQLAIQGGSNGGLLVGAVVNQRPDLFAAALPAVGVMDMLRFDRWTAGRYWVDDYGYPSKEADFRALFAYSPYHNIKGGQDYPAILATTADTDDRVVPGHNVQIHRCAPGLPTSDPGRISCASRRARGTDRASRPTRSSRRSPTCGPSPRNGRGWKSRRDRMVHLRDRRRGVFLAAEERREGITMRVGRLVGAAVAAVTMIAVAAPAEAQRWGGRHRHHDRVDGGDVLLGAVLAGGLIALVSGANKADRERRDADRYDVPPPPRADAPPPEWLPDSSEPADYAGPAEAGEPAGIADIANADDAADACAGAALAEGQSHARVTSIGAITSVDQAGTGWSVRGSLVLRDDYRTRGNERGFQCTIAGAGAPTVRIDGY